VGVRSSVPRFLHPVEPRVGYDFDGNTRSLIIALNRVFGHYGHGRRHTRTHKPQGQEGLVARRRSPFLPNSSFRSPCLPSASLGGPR
jgi:hypothetical protein